MEIARPWPNVTWDRYDLDKVAAAVRLINPMMVHDSVESAASYIRSVSERDLYRVNPEHGHMVSTGGWQVTFLRNSGAENSFSAWPAITGYTALKYAEGGQGQSPN
jgi:hypothetical protein